ncbi:MAG: hypothetical protein O9301_11080 [Leptospira sp.]|nr:hypothetical protein [Leptospira sp.]
MNFFRDVDKMNELTPDDRIEIFRSVLLGSTDITKELLDDLINNYSVGNLEVIELRDEKK